MDRPGYGQSGPLKLIGLLLMLNLGVFLTGMAMQHWSPAAQAPLVFNAEKIRLLALPESANTRVAAERSAQPEAQATSPVAQRVAAVEPTPRCLSWTSLDAAGLIAIEAVLKQVGIAAKDYEIELEKTLGWWVFLPPLENGVPLRTMIDEVRRLGVTDYVPVRAGAMRNALSLGVFERLAQAREHAVGLSKKGIKGVKYGPRPEAGAVRLVFSASLPGSALPNSEAAWPNGLKPAQCVLPWAGR